MCIASETVPKCSKSFGLLAAERAKKYPLVELHPVLVPFLLKDHLSQIAFTDSLEEVSVMTDMVYFQRIWALFTGQKIKSHVCKISTKHIWFAKIQFLSI